MTMFKRRRRFSANLLLAGVAFGGLCAQIARGHAVFMTYIQHDVRVSVGPENIDITLEMTFNEFPSLTERRKMDRDADGRITPDEIKSYLAGLEDKLRGRLTAAVDGQPLTVMPLFEPRVDLLGVDRAAPAHHVLRLFYFARTPEFLHADSEIVIEDHLWPDAPTLSLFEATGADGVRVSTDSAISGLTETSDGPPVMRVRCLAVPEGVGHHPQEASVGSARMSLSESVTSTQAISPPGGAVGWDPQAIRGIAAVSVLLLLAGVIGCARINTGRRASPAKGGTS